MELVLTRHRWTTLAALLGAATASGCAVKDEDPDAAESTVAELEADCAARSRDECNTNPAPSDGARFCQWVDSYTIDGDSCQPGDGRCVAVEQDDDDGCDTSRMCDGDDSGLAVYFRERDDGGIEMVAGRWCGPFPLAWSPCGFDRPLGDEELQVVRGPASCTCACEA